MSGSSQFDSTPAGFISTQTADPSPTSAKTRDAQTLRPVTIKQIIEATPSSAEDKSDFLIDDINVYSVKLVGMVFEKTLKKTDATFVVDDGTGRIGCTRWMHDKHDNEEVEDLTDGIYVRVLGRLKLSKSKKKQVDVYAARPVKDYNEIANHFIECAHAHSCNTRLQINGSATLASSTSATTPIKGHQGVPSSQGSLIYNLDGLRNIEQMVMDYLRQPSSLAHERGIHRDVIAQALKISQEKIKEALESLESEGLAYSTVDEYTYKSVSS